MAEVEIGPVARVRAIGAPDLKQEVAAKSANEYANGKAGHADTRGQQNSAQNNHDVVNHRSDGRYYELPLGILHGAEDAAFVKGELGRQHKARKEDNLLFLLRPKSGGDQLGRGCGAKISPTHTKPISSRPCRKVMTVENTHQAWSCAVLTAAYFWQDRG